MEAGGVPVTGDEGYRDPRWRWPEYAPGTVIELRVHGVGGESPAGMTRDEHPVRIGGNEDVGFWRARFPGAERPAPADLLGDATDGRPPGTVSGAGHGEDASSRRGAADSTPPRRVREVVSWGGSTSGRRRNALWVLLLPFALFNAAGRMAPGDASDARHEAHQLVCRLLALSLTLSLVAMTSGVVFDLLALQCGSSEACANAPATGRWLLAPLRWFPLDAAGLLAVAALVPLAVPFGLRFVGRVELAHRPPLRDPGEALHRARGARMLHEPDMWHARWPSWRLRGLHITAGYAWVLLVLGRLVPAALPDAAAVFDLVPLVAVAVLVGCAVLTAHPRVAGSRASRPFATAVLGLRWATLVPLGVLIGASLAVRAGLRDQLVLGTVAALAAIAAFGWATVRHVQDVAGDGRATKGPSGSTRDVALLGAATVVGMLSRLDGTVRATLADLPERLEEASATTAPLLGDLPAAVYEPTWVLVAVQALLLVTLVATSGGSGSDRDGRGTLAVTTVPGNLTAPVVALVTMLLVTAVGAGLHALVLDWAGERVTDLAAAEALAAADAATALDPRAAVGLVLPWWYLLTAQVVVGTAVVLAVVVVGLWLWLGRTARPTRQDVLGAVGRGLAGPLSLDDLDDARRAAVEDVLDRTSGQWLHQALVRRAGAALGLVVAVALAGVLVVAAVVGPADLATTRLPGATVSLAVVVAIPPVAVALLRAAREDRVVRRQIGILWDVLCFWPRVTHPFAPPSYGEALVPTIVERLNRYPADSTVVLAGHSQGSVIALAATVHPALAARRLHLVTYGSPVSLLYEGFFPSVFGGDAGAIARATPTARTADGSTAASTDATTDGLVTWHNVLTPTEPISTPIWAASDPGPPTPTDDAAWPVVLRLPWSSCPACGWARPPDGDPTPVIGERRAVDVTVTDPDRLLSPSMEVDGRPGGHSSYHRSLELDLHLAHLR